MVLDTNESPGAASREKKVTVCERGVTLLGRERLVRYFIHRADLTPCSTKCKFHWADFVQKRHIMDHDIRAIEGGGGRGK